MELNLDSKLFNWGVSSNKLTEDFRITRMLNICCSYTFLGAMILMSTPFLQNKYPVNPLYFSFCLFVGLSYALVLIFNVAKQPHLGRLIFGFILPLWPVVTLILVGHQFAQICAACVTTLMQYFIFRNHKKIKPLAVLYNIILACTALIYISFNPPLMENMPDYVLDDLGVYLLSMSWIFIAFDVYEKDNQKLVSSVTQKNEELKYKTHELEQFAYVTSHDLKNPIRNILNFSSLLKNEKMEQLDEDGKKFVGFINESSKRMNRLVEDMLHHSIIGTNGKRKRLNLNEILKGINDDIKTLLEKEKAHFHVTLMPEVYGLETEIRSLFLNIISNALKYSSPKRPLKIQIVVFSEDEHFTFLIRDNGLGFDMKYYDKIFTAFQRLDQSVHKEGTGIGLANCRKIVELHGGKIWAESILGEGSSFYFTLPKKKL